MTPTWLFRSARFLRNGGLVKKSQRQSVSLSFTGDWQKRHSRAVPQPIVDAKWFHLVPTPTFVAPKNILQPKAI